MLKHPRQWLRSLRGSMASQAAVWVCAAALTVAGLALAIGRLAESHLQADAERTAAGWARHVGTTVPDIDLVFMGDVPSPQAQDRLVALRGTAGLFRFRLYDPRGSLLLQSESVGTPPRPEDIHTDDAERARQAGSTGQVLSALKKGDGREYPEVYSRAFVPVRHGAMVIGVIEVDLDQTELAATTASSFRRAAALAGTTMTLSFALVAAVMRRQARQERRARERAIYLAEHDVLTGAINRTRFGQMLEHACQASASGPGRGLAVLCVDLDGFAAVNDLHGSSVGDDTLRRVAQRLRAVLRGADLLARLGGDRFAVLQCEAADSAAVGALAQRIVDSLARPHALGGTTGHLTLTACVGAALQGPDGQGADSLLQHAELALQRAKAAGRGTWSFYDPALDQALQERRLLAQDLREAIAGGSLRLHFQPLYAAASGELTGYEALARWPHPVRGFVPPMEFIAIAEETGQIEALGRWVLDSACQEAATWPGHLTVAVNLSAAQFRRGDAVVREVQQALQTAGLPAWRLELEITESLLMNHTEQVLGSLRVLHTLGARIAMDDFGTGYSSLAYLWRFPFDKLKIDRAFTQGLGSDGRVDAIVRSIVTMAHALNMRVNVEGVETAAQREALSRLGCDELQGYLMGRPQPAERLPHLDPAAAPAAPAFMPSVWGTLAAASD
jgi:diguanylate cyclase (GGDEF)-like protein